MSKVFSIIQKTAVAAGLIMAVQSCKVDIVPTSRYTEEAVWSNPSNIELYIMGMYSEFKTFQFGTFPIGYNNATDALTDIMKFTATVAGNGTVNLLATDASRVNAASPQLSYWSDAYTRIRRLNEFMSGINGYGKIDAATKNQYLAEARFIRGYVYFWLAKLHGSVILLNDMSQYNTNLHQRSSEDSVYRFIAADFQFAADNLPKQWGATKTGRATKGAAYGMLARTWLYAASIAEYDKKQFNSDELTGVAAANSQAYYQNAANAAQAVIDLAKEGYYELESNFANIFTNKSTKEAIFKLSYVSPQLTHSFDLGYAPPADASGQCLVYGVPTAELVNEFEMSDGTKFLWSNTTQAANPYLNREQRFYATVLYNGATWKGRTINSSTTGTTEGFIEYGLSTDPHRTVTGYYLKKMLDPANTTFVTYGSTQDWIEMRYAEILLIHAEAEAKLNNIGASQQSINAVRTRAGLPNTLASTAAQLMEAVEHERKVELAFEGQRYWDLRRWRKAHTVLNGVKFTGHKITPSGGGYTYEVVNCDNMQRQFTSALYYLPIPSTELLNNTTLTQIKGW
ncbi:MAG: RagB/SusD family nutrient uptake outer membrane protein [Chitinophagaceae bacterium]